MIRRRSALTAAVAAATVGLVGSPVAGAPPARPEPDVVQVAQGTLRGTVTDAHRLFKGIPFAAPPVGALRWRPPQPAAAWSGVRDATTGTPSRPCPQPQVPTLPGESNRLGSTDEDCLYLSVWTPATRAPRQRPVFVWLHGGANVVGAGSDYNAGPLAGRGDIVVVAVNYRLGSLGFLAHPALSAESPDRASGDYGLMDQQAAMRWVRDNIRAFGGDPGRVTIGGQSAGSQDTCAHVASPTARGLFIRAIQLSGTCVAGGSFSPPSLGAASVAGQAFAAAVGCAEAATATECLRGRTAAQLLAGQTGRTFGPNVGPAILPVAPAAAWATGAANEVPTLIGSTHDEWRYFTSTRINFVTGPLTAQTYAALVRSEFPGTSEMVLAEYPAAAYPSPGHAYSALKTDQFFACPARADAILYSRGGSVFQYEFNDQNAPSFFHDPNLPQGAFHAADVGYLFRRAPLSQAQERLSQTMIGYVSTFVATGDPNRPGLPRWPRYRAPGVGSDRFDDLAQSLAPDAVAPTPGFAADHRCAFWRLAAGTPG